MIDVQQHVGHCGLRSVRQELDGHGPPASHFDDACRGAGRRDIMTSSLCCQRSVTSGWEKGRRSGLHTNSLFCNEPEVAAMIRAGANSLNAEGKVLQCFLSDLL